VTVFVEEEEDEEDEDEDEDVDVAVLLTAATVGVFECGVKPSVAPRPAAVAARTMGARFMVGSRSEREGFVMKVGVRHACVGGGGDHKVLERLRAAEVHVAVGEVGHEPSQGGGVDPDVLARADELVQAAAATVDEVGYLVVQDEIRGARPAQHDLDV
jgi:hypothetical protein